MIDVINLIERLTGKKASQYDVDWVEALLEREAEQQRKLVHDKTVLSCGCMMGWCDCNG